MSGTTTSFCSKDVVWSGRAAINELSASPLTRGSSAVAGQCWSRPMLRLAFVSVACIFAIPPLARGAEPEFDVIVRGGTVYDGSGNLPRRVDVGIRGDKLATVGDLSAAKGKLEIDVKGLAVAPGFINMLSWSNESLLADGRSQSEVRQGVTTQIMGEGDSMGPLNDAIRKRIKTEQTDIKYEIEWQSLSDYLTFLE